MIYSCVNLYRHPFFQILFAAFCRACTNGHNAVVQNLMRYKNFHVLLNEENGDSVLHAAVSSQNPILITLILEVRRGFTFIILYIYMEYVRSFLLSYKQMKRL